MKKFYLLLLIATFTLAGYAQKVLPEIQFKSGNFKPGGEATYATLQHLPNAYFKDRYYLLATFFSLPDSVRRRQLEGMGINLEEYLGGLTYFVNVKLDIKEQAFVQLDIASLDVLRSDLKIDPSLATALPNKADLPYAIAVCFSKSFTLPEAKALLTSAGASVISTKYDKEGLLFIQLPVSQLKRIADLPFILSLNYEVLGDRPLNYNNNAAHGNASLSYNGAGGRNLSGRGVTIGVGDNADVSSHIDFAGRLINRNPTFINYHGTHTTGTTAGGGIADPKFKGMSPRATIVSQLYSDIITNSPTLISDYNLTLTNNSYYDATPGCAGEGAYDVFSNYGDAQQRNIPQLLHVIAAGNDAGATCSPFPAGFGTIKSGWQSGKNALIVGALNNADNSIAFFSSRGPVADGRLKPEVVAGGLNITSTFPNNTYGTSSGTSMATPTVTGSLGLLSQRFKELNGGLNPSNALLKALVCNTAEDLGNAGPDYTYGFGKLNTRKAVEALEGGHYSINTISNTANNTQTLTIPPGISQLKIMLYWNDKEAALNPVRALVNDLDLRVTDPSAVVHHPLVLNPSPASVNLIATEGTDHLNNIEQVVINNPVAGIYNINVNGYAIPFGPQEYVITYDMISPSVYLEYPYGGETWVPASSEIIRWYASDPDTSAFILQYSIDNGASYVDIDNNVAANRRNYTWTVPSVFTNQAIIKVSRNNTVYSDKSHFAFTILDQPVITVNQACPTYAQINWSPINGATSYDILLLDKDSMKVAGNTNDTTFMLSGLSRSKGYWVSVAAKNGVTSGMRSLAVNFVPNGGTCTLSNFDNDLIADSILEPITGRQFTSTSSLPALHVKVRIRNLDDAASTIPFNVSYSINGGAVITELEAGTISPGGTLDHSFTSLPGGSFPLTDTIKVWVTKSNDVHHENDTALKVVKYLANPVRTLPFTEGFESAIAKEYDQSIDGLDGLDDIDSRVSSSRGRARTFVNTGFARTGHRAITLDQAPASVSSNADSLLMTLNLSNYSIPQNQLRLDFYFKSQGQPLLPGNKVWIRGSDTNAWVPAYDLNVNQVAIGQYKFARAIIINDLLQQALPPQNVTSSFQVRFGQEGYTSANTPYPATDEDDGLTFDDITLSEAVNDVGLIKINSPTLSGCGLGNSVPVNITVRNYASTAASNVQVNYRINSGTIVSEIVPVINGNQTINYTFITTANLSAYIDYSVDVWVKYANDNYANNDSLLNYTFHNSPVITAFPYLERFESSNGNWYSKGVNSSWQWMTPSGTIINKAAGGTKAWITNSGGTYNNNESSYLYSPCYDVSTMTQPVFSFSHIHKMEDNCDCDYHWVEYSTDGITWQILGSAGSGTNWYDNASNQRWQLSNTRWHVSSIDLPTGLSVLRFRIAVKSDDAVNFEGIGIDDVHIFEKASIYSGPGVTTITNNVNGNTWIHYSVNGKRVASINPYGQDLGATAVGVYFNIGSPRVSNNQYYLNRNIVIRPAVQPSQYVGVRYYFTDAEAYDLINATGCASCTTIHDPYEAGVTKYSGSASDENGTLADDSLGFFQFILPVNVDKVPYDNGYYAEYGVNSFSEFWINNGGVGGISPLPITLLTFTAAKFGNHVRLTWSTSQEVNSSKFIIERSSDGRTFSDIGVVNASGNSTSPRYYSFDDQAPFSGLNYYRLKLIDLTNSIRHSIIRKVDVNSQPLDLIYPNPVKDGKVIIQTSYNCSKAELLDITGKLLEVYNLHGNYNVLSLPKGPAGIYQIRIYTSKNISTQKIVIE